MPLVRYRPAVRKRGEVETFAQSLMTFTTASAANGEVARLKGEWSRRYRGELESVLLLEVEACPHPSTKA